MCHNFCPFIQFLHKFSKHSEPCWSVQGRLFLLSLQTLPGNDGNTSTECGNEQTAPGSATATSPGLRSTSKPCMSRGWGWRWKWLQTHISFDDIHLKFISFVWPLSYCCFAKVLDMWKTKYLPLKHKHLRLGNVTQSCWLAFLSYCPCFTCCGPL